MEKHKCVDCGFLADGYTFNEVNEKQRRGEDSNVFARDSFICVEGKMDFANETDPSGAGFVASVALTVLWKERDCPVFREWRRGFSPKEHVEMVDREKMLKWHRIELALIIFGNLLAAAVGAAIVIWAKQ
jgi:hypothetical protein